MQRLCVYCGSRRGRDSKYLDAADAFGRALAARGLELVYGGAGIGLMGAVANAVLTAGGQVTGVMPRRLVEKEVAHPALTELHVTDTMHERKARMAELADGFVALPGGIGTLEELFEIWTWAQLGWHQKPCGLLNVAHYYDGLARFLDHTTEQGFVPEAHRGRLIVEPTPEQLLDRITAASQPAR